MPLSPSLFLVEHDDLEDGLSQVRLAIFDKIKIAPTRRPLPKRRSLLVQTGSAFILVDPGFGLFDWLAPRRRLGLAGLFPRNPKSGPQVLRRRLEDRGISPDRIEHIVLTHTRADNIGGLNDFPGARIHYWLPKGCDDFHCKAKGCVPQVAHRPDYTEPLSSTSNWFGMRCRRLAIDDVHLEFVEFVVGAMESKGVLVRVAAGSVLHIGDAVASLDELVAPSAFVGARAWARLLRQRRPFERLLTLQRLRRLAQSPPAALTFTANRGATPRLSVGPGPYPSIGFL